MPYSFAAVMDVHIKWLHMELKNYSALSLLHLINRKDLDWYSSLFQSIHF
jgi:hypothetical protein